MGPSSSAAYVIMAATKSSACAGMSRGGRSVGANIKVLSMKIRGVICLSGFGLSRGQKARDRIGAAAMLMTALKALVHHILARTIKLAAAHWRPSRNEKSSVIHPS